MDSSRRVAMGGLYTLFATSLIQVAASFAVSGPLAISIAIIAAANLPETWIGYYTSLIYASAMIGSLLTPRLLTVVTVGQIQLGGLVATGIGYALFTQIERSASGLASAVLGIVLMGLAYGVIVPASALLLSDRFARQWQPLVVSIRQTGVPVGTALVALVAPLVVQHWGWQSTIYVVTAVIALSFALSVSPLLGARSLVAPSTTRTNMLAAQRETFRHPSTQRLALVSGFYGLNQAAMTTYLVPSLVWLHAMSIGRAAGFLAIATVMGASARIAFGITTSRFGHPYRHLRLIGLASGVAWALILWPEPSSLRLLLGAALLGATAMGWNGILLAQLAREAPDGKTADAVGAGTALAYFGVLVAPFIYVMMLAVSHDKTIAITTIIALSIGVGALLLRRDLAGD